MNRRRLQLLLQLLAQPTAPFREQHVAAWARELLTRHRVPWFTDPAGNLVVGCNTPGTYRRLLRTRSGEPLRLFIAHMDHPGFQVERALSPRRLAIRWHGGSPVRGLENARVWLAGDQGYCGEGRLRRVRLRRDRHGIDRAEVTLTRPIVPDLDPAKLFGGFAFRSPVWQTGKLLHTKAADDLVGVFAILATAIDWFARPRRGAAPFLGLLTRGEEVGFVGAIAHFELGWLESARRPLLAVSLETSRTLPGAAIGKGPVVRLGDRRTVFDANALQVLSEVAQHALPARHQRRIMDGGSCEATAATAFGIPAIGLSVPLGNYHNAPLDPPRSRAVKTRGAAAEFVHLDDVAGLLTLCRALLRARLRWQDPWNKVRGRLVRNRRRYQRLLKN